jgi:UDP-N-acetylglucosamine 2-epimerase (non-hydrolysing)
MIERIARRLPLIWPMHPRTRKRLEEHDLRQRVERLSGVHVVAPLGYVEFMSAVIGARFALTDSGGVQEETTALGIPCVTLRPNTERPITVTEGTNQLVESDASFHRALQAANGRRHRIPELWDGHTAERIAQDLVGLASA